MDRLDIVGKTKQLDSLEAELAVPEIWNNPSYAQDVSKKVADLKNQTEPWVMLQAQVKDLLELIGLDDSSLQKEFEVQIEAFENQYASLKKELLYDGDYDTHDAILRITAGVGGTDLEHVCDDVS